PGDHLAWFVLAAVDQFELAGFYAAYRADGHGRAAYDPAVVVALVLYSFSTGVESSRKIEGHCRQDVAFRVITGNVIPDRATIARFLRRHELALSDLFSQVLDLCARAGLVASGVVAVDGMKVSGNANRDRNLDYDQIAREIIAGAIATDEIEDQSHGDGCGDELPEELSTPQGRAEWLGRELAREQDQDADEGQAAQSDEVVGEADPQFDVDRIVDRVQGRKGWAREARRQLERERTRSAGPVPRSRPARLRDAAGRLEDELVAEARGNRAYEAWRAQGRARDGKRFGRGPNPWRAPEVPAGVINLSDPDTKLMKGMRNYVQGYHAQAIVNERQIVLAAEITNDPGDFSHLRPMIDSMLGELDRAGVQDRPEIVVADAGYWNEEHINDVIADRHMQVLIPPDSGKRHGPRPGWDGGLYTWMRHALDSDTGRDFYRRRRETIEPLFGHTKHNRKFTRFPRRGRLSVRTDWRLLMATHNLTKLHRHQLATG
ncbi:MAG: transposase, partial [Solirubrobacteraceae bacterium]